MCARTDGIGLFYPDQYNVVFGDPEGGKTLLTDYATVCELADGGRVLRLDLDHNGPQSTIGRLLAMGAPAEVLRDPTRFLYIDPEDRVELRNVVEHMKTWTPTLVVLDSIGELLPMFGSSSNSADEFTDCHRTIIKPLVRTGACVIGIDHLSKGTDSRAYGAGGTIAKKRAIGGTSIRVTVDSAFTPGKGGSAYLAINKDRHGGLRKHSPTGDKEPLAGKFTIWPNGTDGMRAEVRAPSTEDRNPGESVPQEDIDAIAALDPAPTTIADARARLKWRNDRASAAFKAWKATANGGAA
ncbi:AAA family ATPase [Nocardia sp. NPDC051981]|uniref:AAA family ATPase n=1 Tax=Nocardia sp. NPDC051981 TaxID=3155417 RepID=UPI00343ABA22